MKKYSLLIITLLCFVFVPRVYASTVSPVISGTNTVTVGGTTKIYIKANASSKIEGVDVTYKADGNVSVTKASVNSKFSTMGQDGTRYILYAPTPVASGSTILTLTVKGTKVGKGTITVSNMEATVNGETAVGGTKTYNITVKAKATNTDKEENDKVDEALKNATDLVEKAENSLSQTDYDKALQSVNALENSDAKTKLLNRLKTVKDRIDLAKEDDELIEENCEKCKDCEKCNTVIWIAISIALAIALILETGYLIYKNENNR